MALVSMENESPLAAFDYRYWLDVVWQGKWTIVAAVILCFGIAVISGALRKPLYRAQATVAVELPAAQIDPTTAVMQPQLNSFYDYEYYFNSQHRIVNSNTVLERAAEQLLELPPYKGRTREQLVAALRASLTTDQLQETRLLLIQVTRESPTEAAEWANAIAAAYIENNLEARRKGFRETIAALEKLLEKNRENREQAITGLHQAFRQLGIVPFQESGSQLDTGALQEATRALTQAQIERQQAEARYEQALASQDAPHAIARLLPDGSELSVLFQKKAKLEQEYQELLGKGYLPRNPRLVEKKAQIAALEQQIPTVIAAALAQLKRDVDAARLKEEQARQARDAEQQRIQSASTDPRVLDNLIQQRITSEITGELKQVLNRVELSGQLLRNNLTLVDRAVAPSVPINRQSPKILLFGVFAGLFLGLGLVIGKDFIDNTIRDGEEVERLLELPALGEIPHASEGTEFARREAYHAVWTHIKFSRRGAAAQAILVTSATLEEGKTTVSAELARTAAVLRGRTLLVDFDLRRPMLHKRLAMPRKPSDRRGAILIVDDEAPIRNLVAETLGHLLLSPNGPSRIQLPVSRILTAADGVEAVERVKEEEIALAIIDLNLPGLSGTEVMARIKALRPETEIIILTGHASLETAIEAVRQGAYEYLTKPFDVGVLMKAVSRALDRWTIENQKLGQPLPSTGGIAAYLAADAELDDVICETDTPNLWLIPAGKPPQNPFALLDRATLVEFVKAAKRRFEWVIIDSPPVASVSDPAVIASVVDSVIFVVRHNRTDRKLVRRAVKMIRQANDHILGVVLNDIDLKKRRYYYRYQYHYGYRPMETEAETDVSLAVGSRWKWLPFKRQ
jgi:succinoglycan biosynthesis transport protein ExoP